LWRRGFFGRELGWVTGSFELRGRCGFCVLRVVGSFGDGGWYESEQLDNGFFGFGCAVAAAKYGLRRSNGESEQRTSWLMMWV
jgi:hypothetical protein